MNRIIIILLLIIICAGYYLLWFQYEYDALQHLVLLRVPIIMAVILLLFPFAARHTGLKDTIGNMFILMKGWHISAVTIMALLTGVGSIFIFTTILQSTDYDLMGITAPSSNGNSLIWWLKENTENYFFYPIGIGLAIPVIAYSTVLAEATFGKKV